MIRPTRRWLWGIGALILLTAMASRLDFSGGEIDLSQRLNGPSWDHFLGTDGLGRDQLSRLITGGSISIGVATLSLISTGLVGTGLGVWAGWLGGRASSLLTAVTDTLVAIPTVVVAIVVVSVLRPGILGIIAAMTVTGWLPFARLALRLTAQEVQMEYVEAARFAEAGTTRVLANTVWPNISRPLLAHGVLRFPTKLMTFSGLSFLGLGPQPPTPEWGAMLAQGVAEIERTPLLVIAPGSCIVLSGLVVAVFGRRLENRTASPSKI